MECNKEIGSLTTFGVQAKARYFSMYSNTDVLTTILRGFRKKEASLPVMILGGGSNLLFKSDFNGLIIKNISKGIQLKDEDNSSWYVVAKAGENWNDLVLYCLEKGWMGLENLSLIPGSAGAAPIQNIGAYGVEIKDFFHSLKAWHLKKEKEYFFQHSACRFGYRNSIFKQEYKGEFAITEIEFKLPKRWIPKTSYGAIEQELDTMGIASPTPKDISNAVIRIRKSKLPDPAQIGNAGSFFKNPVIPVDVLDRLKADHEIPSYPAENGFAKIPAAWLVEQCGWKGFRKGDAGVHERQALVLVNYGKATGHDIYELALAIRQSVLEKFSMELEMEVNVI